MVTGKAEVFNEVRDFLQNHRLSIRREDQTRPWGGFFVLDENEIDRFLKLFFPTIAPDQIIGLKLSPKVLLVAPHCRLSWQYHNRRAERWTVIKGPVQVAISDTDEEGKVVTVQADNSISLRQGQRHRLMGLDTWGIVAEIWQHTNPAIPSDEDDIVRVQDDYNR
jgi:mannose-6-phosphate isomerase-like protein (cupin superfamily)